MSVAERTSTGPDRSTGDLWSSPEAADRVHLWLRDNADERGEVLASRRVVAESLGMSAATVRRALRRLEDHDDIVVVRRGTGERYGSRYRLCTQRDVTAA